MSIENFELYAVKKGKRGKRRPPYVRARDNMLTFTAAAYEMIGRPVYVDVLFDKENKMMAVRRSFSKERGAKIATNKVKSLIYIASRELCRTIIEIAEQEKYNCRFDVEYDKESKALIVDLKKPKYDIGGE